MGNYCIKQLKTANSSKPLERTALTAPGCTCLVCFVEIKITFKMSIAVNQQKLLEKQVRKDRILGTPRAIYEKAMQMGEGARFLFL